MTTTFEPSAQPSRRDTFASAPARRPRFDIAWRSAVLVCGALAFVACDGTRLQPDDGGSVEPESPPLPIVLDGGEPAEPAPGPAQEPDGDAGSEPGVGPNEPEPGVGPAVEPGVGPGAEPAPEPGAEPGDGGTPNPESDAGAPVDAGPPGPTYSVAAEGESCFAAGGTPCAEGLQCAPIFNSGAGTCAQSCDTVDESCPSGGICTDLIINDVSNLICADRAAPGEGCNTESLTLCGPNGACLADDTQILGGSCLNTCSCAQGETSCNDTCGAQTCIVLDAASGDGFCGAARGIGESCAPAADGEICEGDSICLTDATTPGNGTCRARCDSPGDADPTCLGLATPHACIGEANAGVCQPTNNLGQGEVCTTGTPVPEIARTCATGFACLSVHDDDPAGFGRCLRDCSGGQGDCLADEGCFNVDTVAPGGGARCLRELPRGSQGCNPPEPTCEDTCVVDGNGDGICRLQCVVADCPGGTCACGAQEECLARLADPTVGICGTTVARAETCDETREVFCEDAPGQDVDGNAFSICLDTCYFVCEFAPADGPVVNLTCPGSLECVADPTGRLLPTVKVCVPPPVEP